MDEARIAAEIWEISQPHAPSAMLSYLHRANLPFPSTGLPVRAPGIREITDSGWIAERWGYEYIRFTCPECNTSVFEPATQMGMAHIGNYVSHIHSGCCADRSLLGESTWPDSLEG